MNNEPNKEGCEECVSKCPQHKGIMTNYSHNCTCKNCPHSTTPAFWEEEFEERWGGCFSDKSGDFCEPEVKAFIFRLLQIERKNAIKETVESFSKKITNDKGEPICPKCDKDMERDCQEPDGHLWFCSCSPGLRLSVG